MNLAPYIDHTLLRVDCIAEEVFRLCEEAVEHQFASVCIPPFYVGEVAQWLATRETQVKLCTVIGFPAGYSATPAKVEEIKRAIEEGADEVDAVINLCAVKNSQWSYIRNEMDSLCTAAHMKGKKIKIILETTLLREAEIRQLAEIALEIKPDFLKTSTGFNGGATLEAIHLLRELVDGQIALKASGGIRHYADAQAFIDAGAQRLGTSAGIQILREAGF